MNDSQARKLRRLTIVDQGVNAYYSCCLFVSTTESVEVFEASDNDDAADTAYEAALRCANRVEEVLVRRNWQAEPLPPKPALQAETVWRVWDRIKEKSRLGTVDLMREGTPSPEFEEVDLFWEGHESDYRSLYENAALLLEALGHPIIRGIVGIAGPYGARVVELFDALGKLIKPATAGGGEQVFGSPSILASVPALPGATATSAPVIVHVNRLDGRKTPVNLDLLEFRYQKVMPICSDDPWVLSDVEIHREYYHPDFTFFLSTRCVQYRGPRPGDTFRHPLSGQSIVHHQAHEIPARLAADTARIGTDSKHREAPADGPDLSAPAGIKSRSLPAPSGNGTAPIPPESNGRDDDDADAPRAEDTHDHGADLPDFADLAAKLRKARKPAQANLMDYMATKTEAFVEDVAKHVHDNESTDEKTIRANVRRTNDSIAEMGERLSFGVACGRVYREISAK